MLSTRMHHYIYILLDSSARSHARTSTLAPHSPNSPYAGMGTELRAGCASWYSSAKQGLTCDILRYQAIRGTLMATNIQPYVDQAQVFLEQAYSEMRAGDLRQASEKGWGAASLMVKAVAEKQGEGHSRHRSPLQGCRQFGKQERETRNTGACSRWPESCTATSMRTSWSPKTLQSTFAVWKS